MNAMQIAQLVLSILSIVQPVLQPLEQAAIAKVAQEIQAQKASGKKLTFGDVHRIGAEQGLDMSAIYAKAVTLGMTGIVAVALALRWLRRK